MSIKRSHFPIISQDSSRSRDKQSHYDIVQPSYLTILSTPIPSPLPPKYIYSNPLSPQSWQDKSSQNVKLNQKHKQQ